MNLTERLQRIAKPLCEADSEVKALQNDIKHWNATHPDNQVDAGKLDDRADSLTYLIGSFFPAETKGS